MTFDPEQNRIPTGLLSRDERAALQAAKYGWERFITGFGSIGSHWQNAPKPDWIEDRTYRAKPAPAPTILVNGIEVPEPVREALADGQDYYLADPTLMPSHIRHWDGLPIEEKWLNRGLIHLTKEAAVAHAKAMLAPSMRGDV